MVKKTVPDCTEKTKKGRRSKPKSDEEPPTLLRQDNGAVYKTVKFMLNKLRRAGDEAKIEDAVGTCHAVATRVLDFVKLYLEDLYVQGRDFPVLDKNFYLTVIRVILPRKETNEDGLSQKMLVYTQSCYISSILNFYLCHRPAISE